MSQTYSQVKHELKRLQNDPDYSKFHDDLIRREDEVDKLIKRVKDTVADSPEEKKIKQELRKIVDFTEEYIKSIEQRVNQIEFVNRLSEVQYITGTFCPPYLLISSPMEYGKTRLIEAVKVQMQKQNWYCINIELSRKKSYSVEGLVNKILQQLGEEQADDLQVKTPEKYGAEIGIRILSVLKNTEKNVLILVDESESVNDDLAKQFLNQFILVLKEVLSISGNIQLRLILAGRYISNWTQLGLKIPLKAYPLTPFDFSAIHQTVEHFAYKSTLNLSTNYKPEIASHLMHFTGGHPGCMAKILTKDFGYPAILIASNEEEYYTTIVKPVIDEIKEHIHPDLREIFDTLSVIRRYNPHLLRRFMDCDLIQWPKSEYDLQILLLQTYLVHAESGFLKDDITRRLLAIHLRRTDLDHFIRVCKEAVSFYESILGNPKSNRPDIIAVELLFQKMQYIFFKQGGGKEQLIESLCEVFDTLLLGRSWEVLDSFIELLNDDWEFRFTFNYLLRDRERSYDESLFNELMGEVKKYKHNLQGDYNV